MMLGPSQGKKLFHLNREWSFANFGLSIIADVVHKSILHAQPNTAQLCFDPITNMDSDPSEISVPVLIDQSQRMSDPYGLSKE